MTPLIQTDAALNSTFQGTGQKLGVSPVESIDEFWAGAEFLGHRAAPQRRPVLPSSFSDLPRPPAGPPATEVPNLTAS